MKNGKTVRLSCKVTDDIIYTIFLQLINGLYSIHYYCIDGNDVFDEDNYRDEHTYTYDDFNKLYTALLIKFPNLAK